MGGEQTALSKTIGTDTEKLVIGKADIGDAIGKDGTKKLEKNQIPPYLEKFEKDLAKRRNENNN